jgi:hypothetical protein
MNGPQRYNFDQIREQFNHELLNEQMPDRLYKSTDNITRLINAIVKTKGEDWATHVVNDEGKPILSNQEQVQFTEAFQPYVETILEYFGEDDEMSGGVYNPDMSKMSGMSKDFLKTKAEQATHRFPVPPVDPTMMFGMDDIYAKVVGKIGNVNSVVNDYASKYGVLKLEKEHDLEEDVRVIPQPVAVGISSGVTAITTPLGIPIPPPVTQKILSKVKVPFRTIVFVIYLALDVARIAISVSGNVIGRKIMSILLAVLELLKGDWKKAILTLIGYFGTMPLLMGELLKVFLSLFRMLAPQIQHSIIFGSFDTAKSFIVGVLLSIFQVTAPEQVRLPLIGALEKIAQKKAEMDGVLIDVGLSARPDYLSPTWSDLNNIQAVMSDEAYLCSCEFQSLIEAVNKAAIIRIVLQLLRIPVNKDFVEYKCGKEPCKDFVTTVVKEAKEEKEAKDKVDRPFSLDEFEVPVDLDPLTSMTVPVGNNSEERATLEEQSAALVNAKAEEKSEGEEEVKEGEETTAEGEEEVKEGEKKEEGEAKAEGEEAKPASGPEEKKKNESKPKLNVKGGRILHSRRNRQSLIA